LGSGSSRNVKHKGDGRDEEGAHNTLPICEPALGAKFL